MRKKTRCYQRSAIPQKPRIVFALDQLALLEQALVPLEQMVATATAPLPNLQFALETVTQVQEKIHALIRQGVWGMPVGFDANEILVLQTAVRIFEVALEVVQPSPEGEDLKIQCGVLNRLFAPITRNEHRQEVIP